MHEISVETLASMSPPDPALMDYAKASSLMIAGIIFGQTFVIGIIPQPAYAYIWLQILPAKPALPLFSVRQIKQFIAAILVEHHTLLGHCNTPIAKRWWASLGATFLPVHDDIFQFEIKS